MTGIKLQPTPDCILICVYTNQPVTSVRIEIETNDGLIEKECNGTDVQIPIPSPHYWSPSDPYLYAMRIKAEEDTVESYFALRTVSTRVINGIPRLCLNGKPYYLHGVLDQGYWKAGICLPPEDNGYEKDIRAMKDLGFNTLRKHIRIESLTFYEACDRLGMLVIQDFVNNGKYRYLQDGVLPTLGFTKCSDLHLNRDKKARQIFRSTAKATVAHLYNSPCILGWTIFNEGWGQFCADEMYDNLKTWDPNRFTDATSGWFAQQKSDVISKHVYFRRFRAKLGKKPLLLSEFGGYQLSEENGKHFVYRFFRSQQDYQNAVVKLYRSEIIPAVSQGLCGSIYTQLSDVENEINGFLTYDRRKLKIDKSVMRDLAKDLMNAFEESCKEKRD